jgi:hypothetical protein
MEANWQSNCRSGDDGGGMVVFLGLFAAAAKAVHHCYDRYKKLRHAWKLLRAGGSAVENGEVLRIGNGHESEYIWVEPVELQRIRNAELPAARIV